MNNEILLIFSRWIRVPLLLYPLYRGEALGSLDFFNVMTVLADQIGNLLNKNELLNTLKLHADTINNYLYVLRKCFHVDLVKPFHKNVRKEITKMPKIFFEDAALR